MEALWHSIINVAIVIASIVVATFAFRDKKRALGSVLLCAAGVLIYVMEIYYGASEGLCELSGVTNFLEFFASAENCLDSHSYGVAVAQVAIISALLLWLSMAWQKVFRKLESEEGEKNET